MEPSQAEIDRKRQELWDEFNRTATNADLAEALAEAPHPIANEIMLARRTYDAISFSVLCKRQFEEYFAANWVEPKLNDWIDDYPARQRLVEDERRRDDNVFNVETQS